MGRLALAGHSRGGVLSAAYAADHPGTLKGALNFSGGWKQDTCGMQDINLDLFAAIGQRTATPGLFLYARGDGFYADASMQKYGEAYRNERVAFQFRLYELKGANGHLPFKHGRPLWSRMWPTCSRRSAWPTHAERAAHAEGLVVCHQTMHGRVIARLFQPVSALTRT
jgi:dienelactone hydrolase